MAKHWESHPTPVDSCFGCHALSIQVSPAAMASRVESNASYRWQKGFDQRNDTDRAAYKRMRDNGLQPPRIDGCATLEAGATTEFEVASGQVFAEGPQKAAMKSAVAEVEDAMGSPLIPKAAPMVSA